MERSETIKELAAALAKAQATMQAAVKDSENPHFRSRYADLASVWESVRRPLTDHGLSVVQFPVMTDRGTVAVETVLLHESGEFIGGIIEIPVTKPDAQGIGSAVTYGRRYSLAAVAGIAPDDDDGEAAVGRGPNKPTQAKPQEPPPKTGQTSPPPAADPKDAEYVERVRGALRQLYGNDKSKALAKVEELTSFTGKDGQAVAGVRDFTKLTGKRLQILVNKLEKLVKDAEAPQGINEEPRTACEHCGGPLNTEGLCEDQTCIPF